MKKYKAPKEKPVTHTSTDFEFINMPHNRRELFFDVIKQRWRTLYLLGLFFLLSILPLFACLVLEDNVLLNVYSNPSLDLEAKRYSMFNLSIIVALIIFVCIVIESVFLGGILRNVRNLSWEDPIFLKDDFRIGIANSWKPLVLSSVIYGVFVAISSIAFSYPGLSPVIKGVIIAILALVITPLHMLISYQTQVYENKYRDYFYNAVLLYVRFFFIMLLLGLIFFIPVALYLFVPNIVIKYTVLLLYLALLFPLVLLLFAVILNYVFDKGINEKHYPEIAGKGIYKEKDL